MKLKIVIIAFCLVAGVANAQTTTEAVWDYPVKPGSEEWRRTSYVEKVEKSQPPKELLASWDTETLFKYCVDYPFNKDVLLFNDRNTGFRRVYELSSLWKEFIRRKDAMKNITQYFEARPYKRLFEMKEIETRNHELFTLYFLEKLVSETDFVLYLDALDKKKLANVILLNHQSKKDHPEDIFGYPYNSSSSALLKILESAKSLNDEVSLAKFREKTGNEYFTDEAMDAAIIKIAANYINQ